MHLLLSRDLANLNLGGAGTFFVNCLRICRCETELPEIYYAKGNCSINQAALVRMVREGHMIADHSYNHMSHNSPGIPYHAYKNPLEDMAWFGEKNSKPVADMLRESGIKHQTFILKYFLNYLLWQNFLDNNPLNCTVDRPKGHHYFIQFFNKGFPLIFYVSLLTLIYIAVCQPPVVRSEHVRMWDTFWKYSIFGIQIWTLQHK